MVEQGIRARPVQRRVRLALPALLFLAGGALALWAFGFVQSRPLAPAQAAELPLGESWMGMYISTPLGEVKAGYVYMDLEKDERSGQQGYRLLEEMHTRLKLLATQVVQHITSEYFLDGQFAPREMKLTFTSGGTRQETTAKFYADRVDWTRGEQTGSVPIPEGVSLSLDPELGIGGREPKPGDKWDEYMFEPIMTLSIQKTSLEVLGEETIQRQEGAVTALKVKVISPEGTAHLWLDAAGGPLRMEMAALGSVVRLEREPREQAMALGDGYAPGLDLAVATRIPSETVVKGARTVTELKVRVEGIPEGSSFISDTRQQVSEAQDGECVINIQAAEFDPSRAVTITQAAEQYPDLVKATPYLEADDPQVIAAAKEAVGDAQNAYAAAVHIHDWVYRTMTPTAQIGLLRSAGEVLDDPRGVCRDYAALTTGLCRAAEIPARLCMGLVYWSESGKEGFYYHAWTEAFVGEWVPLDSTLPGLLVDATHIKLAQGDVADFLPALRLAEKLKVEVLEYH